ncbi:hypothetical protein, partial [Kitasatospora sp. LaBMicrA B282]|uniref:hypothetical protein n=1 Tax=Kitasatospora sp. LaBMicrA B282 TaxID=3420949 RepID=UPI003D0C02C1
MDSPAEPPPAGPPGPSASPTASSTASSTAESPAPLDAAARALYREILRRGGRLLAADVDGASREPLDRLCALGLVVAQPPDASYTAVNPRAAGENAAAALRAEANRTLRAAREAAGTFEELGRAYDTARRARPEPGTVQVAQGMEQIRHRLVQLAADTRREILAAQPGGACPADMLAATLPTDLALLARGIEIRSLYQPGAREHAATARYAATLTAAGGRFRVLDEPFRRLLVFDRAVAVLPAAEDNSSAAFVEDPVLLGVLLDAFERDWARADRVPWAAEADRAEAAATGPAASAA